MAGNISKSVLIADCTNKSFSKIDFGSNSSLPTDLSVENETLLSNNSEVSINGLLGAKSFMERVQCASDVSQLSILFPNGYLDNKKVKKKKKISSSDSLSASDSSKLLSLAELPSNGKVIGKRDCSVNFAFEASSKCNSSASLKKSDSPSSSQETIKMFKKGRNRNARNVSNSKQSSSLSLSDESFVQAKKDSSKIQDKKKNNTKKQIASRKVSVHLDYESSPSISEHSKNTKEKISRKPNISKKKQTYKSEGRTQNVSVNFDHISSDTDENLQDCPKNHLENDLIANVQNGYPENSQQNNFSNVDNESVLNSVSREKKSSPSNSAQEFDNEVSGLRRSRRNDRSRRMSVVFGVDISFPSILNNSKVNNESTAHNNDTQNGATINAMEKENDKNNTFTSEACNVSKGICQIDIEKRGENKSSESQIISGGNEINIQRSSESGLTDLKLLDENAAETPKCNQDIGNNKENRNDGFISSACEKGDSLPSVTYNNKDATEGIFDLINSPTLQSRSSTSTCDATGLTKTVSTAVSVSCLNAEGQDSNSVHSNIKEVAANENDLSFSENINTEPLLETSVAKGHTNSKDGVFPKKHVSVHLDFESAETFTENTKQSMIETPEKNSLNLENNQENVVPPKKLNFDTKISDISECCIYKEVGKTKNVSVPLDFDSIQSTFCDQTHKADETASHLNKTTVRKVTDKSNKNCRDESQNEKLDIKFAISKKNVSVPIQFETFNTLINDTGGLECNTKSYVTHTHIDPLLSEKENLKQNEDDTKSLAKSLGERFKNQQNVSVHFELDSTLMTNVIPATESCVDRLKNTTSEINSEEVNGSNQNPPSDISVCGTILNKSSQNEVSHQNNILTADSCMNSMKNTTPETNLDQVFGSDQNPVISNNENILGKTSQNEVCLQSKLLSLNGESPIVTESVLTSDKSFSIVDTLKEIPNVYLPSSNTDENREETNIDPTNCQHQLNSTYSIESTNEMNSPREALSSQVSNTKLASIVESNDLGAQCDVQDNYKNEDKINSGNELISIEKNHSDRAMNSTYTITSSSKEITNTTGASLEGCTESNLDKGERSSSPITTVVSAEPVHAISCSPEDIPLNSVTHSSLLSKCPSDDIVIEQNSEEASRLSNPSIYQGINSSIGKEQEIIDQKLCEVNLSQDNSGLKQPEDIDCDNRSVGNEYSFPIRENLSQKTHDVSPKNKAVCDDKSLNNVNEKTHIQLLDCELQSKKDENNPLDSENQLLGHQAPTSIECNLPNNTNEHHTNEFSPQLSEQEKDVMNVENITPENELLDPNPHKSCEFQSTNLKNSQHYSEEREMPNLNSVHIDIPFKMSDVPNLSQLSVKDSTPKLMSNLNNNNDIEFSQHLSTELGVSIRATSPVLNFVAQSLSPCGKYITDDSERLRDSSGKALSVDSIEIGGMTSPNIIGNSEMNKSIPVVLQECLVENVPLLEHVNGKDSKQRESQEGFSLSNDSKNISDENAGNQRKRSPRLKKQVEEMGKNDEGTGISSRQSKTTLTNDNDKEIGLSNKISLNHSNFEPDNLVTGTKDYVKTNQKNNIQDSTGIPNTLTSTSKSPSSSNDDAKISTRRLSLRSKSHDKNVYGLRKSIAFSPKNNEKGKHKSVTFASTAHFRSDSQSEDISLNTSSPLKTKATGINTSSATAEAADSESEMSMTEAISVIHKEVPGAFGGQRKNCHSTPIKNIKSHELKEHSNNNKEHFSKNDHIFACPEVPQKLTKSKAGNISYSNKKRRQSESEDNAVGCQTDKSNNSSKRSKIVDKTINELSYDTLLDVSEIPVDKTIYQKKLIYHSTPINPVLEKKMARRNSSQKERDSLENQKDKNVQVSKTFFGTSSEVTSNVSKKKSGDELSTSYSYGGKLRSSKRTSASSNSYSKREVSSNRFSPRNSSSRSSLIEDFSKPSSGQSSGGYHASFQDSSSSRVLRSSNMISTLSHSTDKASHSLRVRFRNFSSHIDSDVSNSINNCASDNFSTSDIRRNVDQFDMTPASSSRVSISEISEDSFNNEVSEPALLRTNVSYSIDEPTTDITGPNIKSIISEYSLRTPQILSLKHKIGSTEDNNKKAQLIAIPKRRKVQVLDENRRLVIDGKLYVPPKIKFREKWVSPKLLDFCINKLRKNYDLEATIIAERVVSHLCSTVSAVKSLNNYSDIEVQTLVLRSILKKYNICSNALEYHSLIMKFTSFEFQRKVLPMRGYFGSLKADSVVDLKVGDSFITETELINIS